MRRRFGKPSISEQTESLGRAIADSLATGLRNPRPLTAEEMAEVAAYASDVAHHSFPALYDDED